MVIASTPCTSFHGDEEFRRALDPHVDALGREHQKRLLRLRRLAEFPRNVPDPEDDQAPADIHQHVVVLAEEHAEPADDCGDEAELHRSPRQLLAAEGQNLGDVGLPGIQGGKVRHAGGLRDGNSGGDGAGWQGWRRPGRAACCMRSTRSSTTSRRADRTPAQP
jgi:hypothetical protein